MCSGERPPLGPGRCATAPTSSCSAPEGCDRRRCRAALAAAGAICLPLPFDRGYHTADFADVSAAFLDFYGGIKLRPPRVPLYSCASRGPFPSSAAGVRKLAAAQWSQTVRFREMIEQMAADGVGCFVEVGPSATSPRSSTTFPPARGRPRSPATCGGARRRAAAHGAGPAVRERRRCGSSPCSPAGASPPSTCARPVDTRPAGRAARQHYAGAALFGERPRGVAELGRGREGPAARDAAAEGAEVDASVAVDAAAIVSIAAPSDGPPRPSASPHRSELDDATPRAVMPRADVMAEYFDVMRGFLEQQRAVVESWQGARASRRRSPVRHEPPFLGEHRRADEHRRRRPMPPEPRRQLPAQPCPLRPGFGRRELSGLACVR